MLTIHDAQGPDKQLVFINSKGRVTPVTLNCALTLWRAGVAKPDDMTARCLIRGYY